MFIRMVVAGFAALALAALLFTAIALFVQAFHASQPDVGGGLFAVAGAIMSAAAAWLFMQFIKLDQPEPK